MQDGVLLETKTWEIVDEPLKTISSKYGLRFALYIEMEPSDLDLSSFKTLERDWGKIARILPDFLPEIFKLLHENCHKPWDFEKTEERTITFEHSSWNEIAGKAFFGGVGLASAPVLLPLVLGTGLIVTPIIGLLRLMDSSSESEQSLKRVRLSEDLWKAQKLLEEAEES